MIEVTSYELTTYVARAAHASGLAEGEATVLAGIVQSLLAAGTDSMAPLLAALDALDQGSSSRPLPRIAESTVTLGTPDFRPISAAVAACQVFDLIRSQRIHEIRLGPVDQPVFIAGAIDSAARCGGPTAALADMGRTSPGSLVIRLHQRAGEQSAANALAPRRVSLPTPVWDALQHRSARLYVPETERSRRLGAGAEAAAALATEMVAPHG